MTNPNWGPVGHHLYQRTYSRVKPDGSKEIWPETVERVVEGNLSLVPPRFIRHDEATELKTLLGSLSILPAGRHLWVSGIRGRQFIFNCHLSHWRERLSDHFRFTFDELMKGGGVGSNYSNRYIRRYAAPKTIPAIHIVCRPDHPDYESRDGRPAIKDLVSTSYHHEWPGCIRIEDTREGWVDALALTIDTAMSAPTSDETRTLVFDVSGVREYGQPIRGFGGVASGPHPLCYMLLELAKLFAGRVGQKLTSIDLMYIDHLIASCTVAGNVRRSARMSIKHWRDPDIFDFIECKSDKAAVSQWTTNISVEIDNGFIRAFKRKDTHALAVYKACIDAMYANGEPGFWNYSLSQIGEFDEIVGTNPCAEIPLNPFDCCNLGHVNLAHYYNDFDGAEKAFRLMARFLIRATFADIASPWQAEVMARNRRIGVGFFGFQDWLCKQGIKYSECHANPFVKALLKRFYDAVKDEAIKYSHELRIPCPIKLTTIAPTGTTAKLAGTSEGAQAIFAPYFEQRIRYTKDGEDIRRAAEEGAAIEDCINAEEAVNTQIAVYTCKHPLVDEISSMGLSSSELVEGQFDISLYDTLSVQAMLQEVWADNAISLTINISKDVSKKELYHTLIKFLPRLKGTTVFPDFSDRPQPPLTVITKDAYDSANGIKIAEQGIRECKGNICPIK